jgi:hypothetical protein
LGLLRHSDSATARTVSIFAVGWFDFREAVLLPLTAVLRSFSEATASYLEHPIDDRTLMRLVMGGLLDQLSNHRAALRGFTAAADDLEPADREEFHRPMREVVTRMGAISRAEAERRGVAANNVDFDTTIRVAVGMIISVVVHDEWLLRGGPDRLTRAQLLEHITEMMLRSMQPPPPADGATTTAVPATDRNLSTGPKPEPIN